MPIATGREICVHAIATEGLVVDCFDYVACVDVGDQVDSFSNAQYAVWDEFVFMLRGGVNFVHRLV